MTSKASACLNLDDLRIRARGYLPRVIYDYLEGGTDDEEGLSENHRRLRHLKLRPRYLVDVSSRSQAVEVLGQAYASPVGIGPMGMLSMVRTDGDVVLAKVAANSGIPFILSGASNASIERIAEQAPGSWFQLYPCKDPDMERDLLRRAAAAGIATLVVSVDVPVLSKRERNIRSGWVRPYKPTPAVILESLRHPSWVANYLRHGLPMMENFLPYAPTGIGARDLTSFYASQVPTVQHWPMIERLRKQWQGKLVLKGILGAEDADLAAAAGADGIIVSNHGGRQLDRCMAAIDALPEVVAAVGDKLDVMFDSGIRRGSDIAVALSLGAKMCFIGRGAAYGLAAFGAPGAQRAIDILKAELDLVLGQIGCPVAAALDARCLWNHPSGANHRETRRRHPC
ncbi:MAG: alpha-hydroxy-acid oxidizing protein [Variovorax sp.]|nr:MAG: alpha-hydroxy-acid oxidizing protein [Variovorax sp.]